MKAILNCEAVAGNQEEKRLVYLKEMFPKVPIHLLEAMNNEEKWDVEKLPWNRRWRRAKKLVVHLYSGDDTKTWEKIEKKSNGTVIIQVELKKGADTRCNDLRSYLQDLARRGKIDLLLAGPPCRTVSICRFRQPG